MDMNIIKEYLISLGVKIKEDSFNQFSQTMANTEKTMKNFAENNKEKMGSMKKFFSVFNSSLKDNMEIISLIIPGIETPLHQVIGLAELLYKGITKVSKGFKEIKTDNLKNTDIKEISKGIEGVFEKTEEGQIPVRQLIDLVRELNVGINKLSGEVNNINLNRLNGQEDIEKSSESIEDFSIKAGEAQKPIIGLISLIKELNVQMSKLSSSNIFKVTLNEDIYQVMKEIDKISQVKDLKTPEIDLQQKETNMPVAQNKVDLGKENFNKMPTGLNKTSQALENISNKSDDAKASLLSLKENGGKAIEDLAKTSKISLGLIAGAFAGIAAIAIASWKTLTSLANQDLGYQKLAMQLWTTKENAKEVDMALKTMKISMQDLWLSPELLQQFNQLRQDSSQLKLPVDAEDKLKLVRSIVFEFKRLKQAGSLAFQWIGYYISKYAGGPLADIHQALNKFVDWVLKNIPEAAKIIGTILGSLFRLILDAIQTIGIVLKPIINTISFIIEIIGKIPAPLKAIIALVIALEIALSTGPLGILLLIIAALDDIFTYFRGGKSVIGSFFDKFKEGANAIKDIKNGWNSFWGGIENFIDRIREKVKKLIKEIKDIPLIKGINDIKNIPGDIKSKVEGFVGSVKKGVSSIGSYILPQSNTVNNKNSTSTQTNHNNTTNNFNIYGTTPTGTANAINSKINNGIKTRNFQGVIG